MNYQLTEAERTTILSENPIDSETAKILSNREPSEPGWFIPDRKFHAMMPGFLLMLAAANRARWTDALTRKDGEETRHEADWIKSLRRVNKPFDEAKFFAITAEVSADVLAHSHLEPDSEAMSLKAQEWKTKLLALL